MASLTAPNLWIDSRVDPGLHGGELVVGNLVVRHIRSKAFERHAPLFCWDRGMRRKIPAEPRGVNSSRPCPLRSHPRPGLESRAAIPTLSFFPSFLTSMERNRRESTRLLWRMNMTENTNDQQSPAVSRRNFLRGALAAVAVVGFDASLGSWATAADLASGRAKSVAGFPSFDGQLPTDDAALRAAADDFGHAVHRRPMAVLKPGSLDDVVRLIDFTSRHGIQVAARG